MARKIYPGAQGPAGFASSFFFPDFSKCSVFKDTPLLCFAVFLQCGKSVGME